MGFEFNPFTGKLDKVGSSGGSTSPLTTKGDVWGFSTVDARIPIGSNDQVLTADSTQALGLKWATPESVITDHGGLTGLSDDDHTQYFLSDGTRQVNSAYLLPAADGTTDYLVKTDGAGQWGYVDPSTLGGSISGTDTHVMFFDGTDNPAGEAGFVYNKSTDSATLLGTLTAEQVTSTDDITLAGILTNTMGVSDSKGIKINQTGYTGSPGSLGSPLVGFDVDWYMTTTAGTSSNYLTGFDFVLQNEYGASNSFIFAATHETTGMKFTLRPISDHNPSGTDYGIQEVIRGIYIDSDDSGKVISGSGFGYINNYGIYMNLIEKVDINSGESVPSILDGFWINVDNQGKNSSGTINKQTAGIWIQQVRSMNEIAGTDKLYGIYIKAITVGDAQGSGWAYYNDSVKGNFLGKDNIKSTFGTAEDASIYYDGTDLVFKTNEVGSGTIKLNASSNWTANGTNTVTISNLAPSGVGTATIGKWLTIKDDSGTVYYIPAWT